MRSAQNRRPLLQKLPDVICDRKPEFAATRRLCDTRARWAVLACVSFMPCGIHMCYKMTSGIQTHLMDDAFQPPIDAFQYGLLNAAVSWANVVVPFFAGPLVDFRSARLVGITSCILGLLGQFLFAFGVHVRIFSVAVAGRCIFGMGETAVTIAQQTAVAQWFRGAELTFAVALTETAHNIGNWSGMVAVSIGVEMGSWWMTLWIGVVVCVVGLAMGCVFGVIEKMYETSPTLEHAFRKPQEDQSFCRSFRMLTMSFWILMLIHLLVSNVEHLFDTISANFIQGKWHTNTSDSAWLSSINYALAIVLCPLVGIAIDKSNWRMSLAMWNCCLLGSSHLLLGLTHIGPEVGVSLLSIPQSILPTILRSSVPLVVNPSAVGLAFGFFGIAENVGKTIGAPLVGYIKDQDGNYTYDEMGFAVSSFVAALFVMLLSTMDRHEREETARELSATPDMRRRAVSFMDTSRRDEDSEATGAARS